jgi:predicted branched-subunit amino acid permease
MNSVTSANSEPQLHQLSALALTAPVAMGYIPLGTVFGFLFVQADAAWWLAVLASVVVFAGAALYMMIPMIAAGLFPGLSAGCQACAVAQPQFVLSRSRPCLMSACRRLRSLTLAEQAQACAA